MQRMPLRESPKIFGTTSTTNFSTSVKNTFCFGGQNSASLPSSRTLFSGVLKLALRPPTLRRTSPPCGYTPLWTTQTSQLWSKLAKPSLVTFLRSSRVNMTQAWWRNRLKLLTRHTSMPPSRHSVWPWLALECTSLPSRQRRRPLKLATSPLFEISLGLTKIVESINSRKVMLINTPLFCYYIFCIDVYTLLHHISFSNITNS